MKIFKTGLRLCPCCGGILIPSDKKDMPACLTCGICLSCALVDTPDGGECRACVFCEFAFHAFVPFDCEDEGVAS